MVSRIFTNMFTYDIVFLIYLIFKPAYLKNIPGHGGAIYGELTVGSMQKMIELMKIHTNFGKDSRFIDVGSGLGKPNLHVTQDPAVEFSYGIEMEHVRWMLGMSNLKTVLEEAHKQEKDSKALTEEETIHHRCIFAHGDITDAKYFDPFTHVYMFDIGFPPKLFKQLGEMFNRSQSQYLICYHGPKLMIEKYGFKVELIVQTPTSMHGSSECHMGYIYRRSENKKKKPMPTKELPLVNGVPCDPLFQSAWEFVKQDTKPMLAHVKHQLLESLNSKRPKRKRS
jgi:Histone methylation protein DOT1.